MITHLAPDPHLNFTYEEYLSIYNCETLLDCAKLKKHSIK